MATNYGLFVLFQGHSSNLHHLMPANIQIIRGNGPAVPPQTFTSHLPRGRRDVLRTACQARCLPVLETVNHLPLGCISLHQSFAFAVGAAAAAVMSSSKTVLRPATGASAGPGQPTVQHIIHQTIQVPGCTIIERSVGIEGCMDDLFLKANLGRK